MGVDLESEGLGLKIVVIVGRQLIRSGMNGYFLTLTGDLLDLSVDRVFCGGLSRCVGVDWGIRWTWVGDSVFDEMTYC